MSEWRHGPLVHAPSQVEEYANKGDLLNDAIRHPERYTERHVALRIVAPLLKVLTALHDNGIIHR